MALDNSEANPPVTSETIKRIIDKIKKMPDETQNNPDPTNIPSTPSQEKEG